MEYIDELLAATITEDQTELSAQEVEDALKHLDQWNLVEDDVEGYQLLREFDLGTSEEAIEFVKRYNDIASEQEHFPDIQILGNMVEITCYTEDIAGLTRNDLIMAAHADDLHARWDIISGNRDKVTEASDESFPASDPPAY